MKTSSKLAISLAVLIFFLFFVLNFNFTGVYAAQNTQNQKTQQTKIEFKDVEKTHWAYNVIYWGVDKGLVSGYDDGTFRPDAYVTEQEFVSVLARYAKNTDKSKFINTSGTYWADPFYDELKKFQLPLKGYEDLKSRQKAITRGEVAKIIAAKNGFNLNERQAVYYMYENNLASGLIQNEMTFESYGVDYPLTRAQLVTFFLKLESYKGNTTFMDKYSNISADEIGGILGIPQEAVEIKDEMFDDMAWQRGIVNPFKPKNIQLTGRIWNGDLSGVKSLADRYGLQYGTDDDGEIFSLSKNNRTIFSFTQYKIYREGLFNISITYYYQEKQILIDTLKLTGKFTDAEINRVIEIIEVEHAKNKAVKDYMISPKKFVTVSGKLDGTRDLYLQFGVN